MNILVGCHGMQKRIKTNFMTSVETAVSVNCIDFTLQAPKRRRAVKDLNNEILCNMGSIQLLLLFVILYEMKLNTLRHVTTVCTQIQVGGKIWNAIPTCFFFVVFPYVPRVDVAMYSTIYEMKFYCTRKFGEEYVCDISIVQMYFTKLEFVTFVTLTLLSIFRNRK